MLMRSTNCTTGLAIVLAAIFFATPALTEALRPCRPDAIWRPARSIEGTPASERLRPTPSNPIGCVHGISFAPLPELRLWRCQIVPPEGQDLAEGSSEHALLISFRHQPWQALPDEVMAGRYRSFEIISIDLDGDGDSEHVLATWNSQGNGLGINRWTVRIFSSDWRLMSTHREVLEWSPRNLVLAPASRRGCDLTLTSFIESRDSRGREGISLEARFLRFDGGEMLPADDRATITRRYDRRFEAERNAHYRRTGYQESGDVLRWLSHPDAVRAVVPPRG